VADPPEGSNVEDVTFYVKDGRIHVKGKLKDKTKPGKCFIRVDPEAEWVFAGIEDAIVVTPWP
jgi:hypothetical protein